MRAGPGRPIAVLLLALHLAACTSWQPTTAAPRRLIEDERPSAIRVTKIDGEQLAVHHPELRGDSIASGGQSSVPLAVAVSDIESIDVQRPSAGRTFGLIMLIGLAGVLATYAYACAALCGAT